LQVNSPAFTQQYSVNYFTNDHTMTMTKVGYFTTDNMTMTKVNYFDDFYLGKAESKPLTQQLKLIHKLIQANCNDVALHSNLLHHGPMLSPFNATTKNNLHT